MFDMFNRMPDFYQGIIYLFAGLTVLLYALGIVEKGITIIIILFALYLVTIGCVKVGLYQKIMNMSAQAKKHKKE